MRDVKTEGTSATPPALAVEHTASAREAAVRAWALAGGLSRSAYLPWAIVGLGIVLRIVRYAADRSLWLDEAYLALNLKSRSLEHLFGTLDFNQAAPPLFLVIEKVAIATLGDSEYVLRLFPLLASVASMVLAYPVTRRYLSPVAVPIALFLFAVLEPFMFFAAEVKQYSSDILVTLVLLYLCARALDSDTRSFTRWTVAIAVAGVVGVALSYPSVFVLVGIGCALLLNAVRRRDRDAIAWVATTLGVVFAAFIAIFAIAIQKGRAVQASASGISPDAHSVVKNTYLVFSDSAGLPRTAVGLAAVIALLGFVSILRQSSERALVIAACVAALLVVGTTGQYPVGQRFLAFMLPLVVIGIAEGSATIVQLRRPFGAALLAGVVALICAPPTKTALVSVVHPPRSEEIVPLLQYVDRHWRQNDVLYVSSDSQYAFRYYLRCNDCSGNFGAIERQRWSFSENAGASQSAAAVVPKTDALRVGTGADSGSLREDAAMLADRQRVWVLVAHHYPYPLSTMTNAFGSAGHQLEARTDGFSALYLYDLRRG